MAKGEKAMMKRWKREWRLGLRSVGDSSSKQDAPSAGEEALEEGSTAAAVIVPVTSAAAVEIKRHVPPAALEVAGVERVDDEAVETAAASSSAPGEAISAISPRLEQSEEEGPSAALGLVVPPAVGVEDPIFGVTSPARAGHDGADVSARTPPLAMEAKSADAPCLTGPLVSEGANLEVASSHSKPSLPAGDALPSRKRPRASESSSPPPSLSSPFIANPSPVPPSSGPLVPELGNLQASALQLGERSLSPGVRAFLERQSAREQMKDALSAVAKVCHYMASFATHASRNYPLELDGAQERVMQLEANLEQEKAALDFLGHQLDQAVAAAVEADERTARREAELQRFGRRMVEMERHNARVSSNCLRAEEELRRLRGTERHQECPGQKKSRPADESSRRETEHPISRKSPSSVRSDRHSEDRRLERGKEVVERACQAAFSAGFEQCLRLQKTSGTDCNSRVEVDVRDEVLKNVAAELFDQVVKTLRPDLEPRKK